jgi:hypothetical protein
MEEGIIFRVVIEVLGRPAEHVESSLQGYIEKIKKDEKYEVLQQGSAEIKKREDQDLWAKFAELEVKTKEWEEVTRFCFDYMPSIIEIVSPKEITFKGKDLSMFLNDMQAKLHQVDMVAKQMRIEHEHMKKNTRKLLKNYITVALGKRELSAQELSAVTGIDKDMLADFLDTLIDEGKIDLNKDKYCLVQQVKNGQ